MLVEKLIGQVDQMAQKVQGEADVESCAQVNQDERAEELAHPEKTEECYGAPY